MQIANLFNYENFTKNVFFFVKFGEFIIEEKFIELNIFPK